MSGPYDKPDDPDDVTLWAGRLRSWPMPPADAGEGDADAATVIARRGRSDGVADDTVIARRRAGSVPSSKEETADEAVDDTAPAARPSRADDDTAPGRRATVGETVRSPRTVRSDDDTAPGRRAAVDETVRSPRTVRSDDDTAPGRHAATDAPIRSFPTPSVDDDTAPGTRGAREALPSQAPVAHPLASAGEDPLAAPRSARMPDPDAAESYRPRSDDAVRVQRSALAPRIDLERDPALVRSRSPRRGAAAPLVIGGATIVVLVGALTAFLVLVR